MARTCKNTFEIIGDLILIGHPNWNFIATASIKDDYAEEIQDVSWTARKDGYLYSRKLKTTLHAYIIRKWYGDEIYNQIWERKYIIEHIDNRGHNCCIDNLTFLMPAANKAKGMTLDIMSASMYQDVSLSMFEDPDTHLFQINIFFNRPAIFKFDGQDRMATIDLVDLLYERRYDVVINEARAILYDYRDGGVFDPARLRCIDYHIEGAHMNDAHVSNTSQNVSQQDGAKHAVTRIVRRAHADGLSKENPQKSIHLRQ